MQWAEEVRIETPEQIDVSLEIAGLGSRAVAQVVDWLIKGLLTFFLGLAFLILMIAAGPTMHQARMMLLALGVVIFYALWLGFDIFYELKRNGQTPGKRLASIRVIREGGGPIDFHSACIRNFLGLADFLPGFYLLGGLLVLLSRRGQRLGDLAAGTIIIRERTLHQPREPAAQLDQLATSEFSFTPAQLAACAPSDRYILRSFFQRYEDMDRRSRHKLANRLAAQFVQKTVYQPVEPLTSGDRAEAFLASLYRDLQNWAQHGG